MNTNTIFQTMKQYFEKHSKIKPAAETFFTTCAIMRIANLHSMNILAVFFYVIIFSFFCNLENFFSSINSQLLRKQKLINGILTFMFTCFYLSDTQDIFLKDLNNRYFQFIITMITALGLYFLLYKVICYLTCKLNKFILKNSTLKTNIILRLPFLCFIFCVLCRIPWLLYSYPGIMTPDSINQFEQVLDMIPYNNHHPWIHTMTISLFYHLGTLFTSTVNDAFVFYTVFQICFMAFSCSYIWCFMEHGFPILGYTVILRIVFKSEYQSILIHQIKIELFGINYSLAS